MLLDKYDMVELKRKLIESNLTQVVLLVTYTKNGL